MRFLYTFTIRLYYLSILVASPFNEKAKRWIAGRKNIFSIIRTGLSKKIATPATFWFHCASLGEFEQGRPVMEKLKIKRPGCKIVLTFFSPSGYEIQNTFDGADHIFYLPLDTVTNAAKFMDLVKPDAVFFVKYEFWYNYMNAIKERNTPFYLISGIFRNDHVFFKWYGGWFKEQLQAFTHFFVQDANSEKLLRANGFTNVSESGDTRFDRVSAIAQQSKKYPIVEAFKGNARILIAGSAWEEDERIIASCHAQTIEWKLIIAPHEINEKHLLSIEDRFRELKSIRYSKATTENVNEAQVLIIDNIGMLSSLYRYADIAFIGGGFGDGIHNILEAAVFGAPVIFGPNYQKFNEAFDLLEQGGAFVVSTEDDLKNILTLLKDPLVVKMAGMVCKNYVIAKKGASELILSALN